MDMASSKTPIPSSEGPGAWWVRLAKPFVRDYEPGYVKLSKELARAAGRPKPWSHAALSRFVATGTCSADLAMAISKRFGLPHPAFVARSLKEAIELGAVHAKYDHVDISETEAEIVELKLLIAEKERKLEEEAAREAAAAELTSKHDKTEKRRRAR